MNKKIVGILVMVLFVTSVVNPIVYSRNTSNEENIVSDNEFGNKYAFSKMGDDLVNIAVTEEFDTSSAPVISLSFHTKYNFEPDFEPSKGEIYIKEAGDHPWTMIKTYSSTQSLGWIDESVDIPDEYNGKIIQLMFKFITFSSLMGLYSSWYVDDIVVDGLVIEDPNVIHYSEDFEGYNVGDPWGDWVIVGENGDDDTPPFTLLSVYGEIYGEEPEYWLTPETILSFIASDEDSGVNTTYYRIWYLDIWSDWMEWEGESFNLSDDGLHYLEWYSVDYADNVEDTNNFSLYVDGLPPNIYYNSNGSKYIDDWLFICVSSNETYYILQGLYAYFIFVKHKIPLDHIMLMMYDEGVDFDKIIQTLNKWFGKQYHITKKDKQNMIDKKKNSTNFNGWIEYDNKNIPENKRKWKYFFFNNIDTFAESIVDDINTNFAKEVDITFYLVDHGWRDTDDTLPNIFCFPDKNSIKSEEDLEYWMNASEYWKKIKSLKQDIIFWTKLKQKDIDTMSLFDFCYSGDFTWGMSAMKPLMDWKHDLAASSSSGLNKSKYGSNIGSLFFKYFWDKLDAGKGVGTSFYETCFKPFFDTIILEYQSPIILPQSTPDSTFENSYPFKEDPITSDTQIILDAVDKDNSPIIISDDGENMEETGIPVGVDYVRYRIDGGSWNIYEDPLTFGEEGTYTLECYSSDLLGNTGDIYEYSIVVDNTPPGAPGLLSPTNGETGLTKTPSFNWSSITNDVSHVYYTLQIATDSSFTNIVFEKTDIIPSYFSLSKTEDLTIGSYYWRIRGIDRVDNIGLWSETWSFTVTKENSVPDKPDRPEGKIIGKTGEEYTYSTVTTDIDGDLVQYIFHWGDGWGDSTDWISSDETISYSHTWIEKGDHSIKVKAIDEHGYESEWSDPLSISMPKTKISNPIIQLFYKILGRFSSLEEILNQIL